LFDWTATDPTWADRGEEESQTQNEQKFPSVERTAVQEDLQADPVIAVIYVGPSQSKGDISEKAQRARKDAHAFVDDVAERLRYTKTIRFKSDVPKVRVYFLEDLVAHQPLKTTDLGRLIASGTGPGGPDVLLGIVDRKSRTNVEVHNIYSELYRIEDRKLGAVTVCTTRQSLEEMFISRKDNSAYFPTNVLRKMKFMLGGVNLKTDALSPADPGDGSEEDLSKMIVVGAHVSHASPDAIKHFPSIAAVVSSLDGRHTHYPGSARLQQKHRRKEEPSGSGLAYEDACIEELKEMMVERFKQWKKHKNFDTQGPPLRVVYYRDGLSMDKKQEQRTLNISKHEIGKITDAYREVFGAEKTCKVTYIAVNNNRQRRQPAESREFLAASGAGSGRVMYTVLDKEADHRIEDIESLTKILNTSSQLAPKVACALPLHYARKLSHRVFDYLYFGITRDQNHIPSFCRLLKGDVVENDEEITKRFRTYLVGDDEGPFPSDEGKPGGKGNGRQVPWQERLNDKVFYL
jgi:hypothetical protein